MKRLFQRFIFQVSVIVITLAMIQLAAVPASAGEYAALKEVRGLNSVFDYSLGSAEAATTIFPAIKGVYEDKNVLALPARPKTVIVFHGNAVKLISTARKDLDEASRKTFDKVAEQIRQFKKDGVTLEVCMYAVNVLGVDPSTLMPEIDRVGNGFISVLGYQAQGYAVVTIQ